MPSLEERIRILEDRAAIQDLVAGYFLAADDDDYAALAQCFTRSARFEASGFEDADGRDGIVAVLKAARAGMGQTVHTPHHVHIRFDGPDAADGLVCAHLELGLGEATYFGAVRYIDRYEREDGEWRLAVRAMKVVHMAPWSGVEASLTSALNVRWPGAEPLPSDFPRRRDG
ncbi:MAG: nuclear transport factor 2 family protein [Novosphingobium sp.]|uniref:nuclear transport factor 2 family protein n=1 Tax=Novosphingobium sp. TaxID=1874826 RepID=UPI00301ADB3D